jgi:hypothetical protein
MTDYLSDPKFAEVVKHFGLACCASRTHSDIAEKAFDAYGDHGSLISGCVRDHFPEDVKNVLRGLARLCTTESDKARNARPARVRHDTIYHIGRLVATRDGSGFYGVQPYRKG